MNDSKLRLNRGRYNNSYFYPLVDSIKLHLITYYLDEGQTTLNAKFRTAKNKCFIAKGLRFSKYFPYIPELFNDKGYILITRLSFGSIIRLHNLLINQEGRF